MILQNGWSLVYKKAIQDDGTLLFPERLTNEFLERAKKTMGSYLFANQYQNEIIPAEDQTFKKHWLKYYEELPETLYHFGFIDPAISEADTADYTGIVVVSTDTNQNWYVRYAKRARLNPSDLITHAFDVCERFQLKILGIEDVAFQRSIIHFAHEEMKRRGKHIPIEGIKRGADKTKEMRILGLVPRFEWGTCFLAKGLIDLETELMQFPRGAYDDLIDSLASIGGIAYYPQPLRKKNERPNPNDPGYESWYIQNLIKRRSETSDE